MQRCGHRIISCCSDRFGLTWKETTGAAWFCFGDLSPTWKEAAEADIAEDSVTTITTTIPISHLHLFREAMAVQKLANGWRARRKKDGKTFNGPLRATEVAVNEDERQMEEAAAVSSERLQEVLGRLVGSLAAPAVQKLANGWRARRKKDGKTFNGPLRATEVAANEDARQMEEAAAVSSERLQEVFDRLSGSLSVPAVTSVPVVTQNGSNWRARVKVGRATVNGPTRQAKAAAEEDAR